MKTLSQRQIKILQCFHPNEVLTSTQLAKLVHLSPRTLRNEIKDINTTYPTLILSIKGSGYQVDHLHSWFTTQQELAFENTSYLSILKQILANEETNYYELAEQLYISESTLDKQIISMNEIINRRDHLIRIERRNNRLYINGNEEQHRQIYTYFMNHEMDQYNFNLANYKDFFTSFSLSDIKAYILEFNHIHQLKMRDFEMISFILHIAIMLERITKGREVNSITEYCPSEEATTLASAFASGLKERFQVSLSSPELRYLSCLFAGKIADVDSKKVQEYRTFVEAVVLEIKNIYDIDLCEDVTFIENLLIHLLGLDSRIRSGSFLNNPLIKDIKLHFPLLYDISVYIAMKIQEQFHAKLLEDEIGFFTLHIMSAVEKRQEQKKKRIVIINPLRDSITDYLIQKLTKRKDISLEICGVLSTFDIQAILNLQPDLIITCFPLQESIDIPVYTCNGFLKEQDYKRILHLLQEEDSAQIDISKFFDEHIFFVNQTFTSKEEVIHFLCNALQQHGYCDADYEKKVLAREKIASTAYGGAFAIPHPIEKCAHKNGIAVCILQQPILWNNKKVRMIFLFALSSHKSKIFNEVFEQLISLIEEPSKVKALLKKTTFSSFVNCFIQENK